MQEEKLHGIAACQTEDVLSQNLHSMYFHIRAHISSYLVALTIIIIILQGT